MVGNCQEKKSRAYCKSETTYCVFISFLLCFSGCIPTTQIGQRKIEHEISPFVKRTLTKKVLPAIVYLKMTDVHGQPISYGWGFFVSPIHIVTNFHVVAWTAAGTAKSVDNSKKYPIKRIVAIDLGNDQALIEVNNSYVKPIQFADSNKVQQGDIVYVVVNPFLQGHIGTFFKGNISRIKRQGNKKSL